MTSAAAGLDPTLHVPDKTTTTVAMDFGRISIDSDIMLYLFGTPGQDRFGFMWHDLVRGALGALVIVDTRRLNECYPSIDYFEKADLPFVVAANLFNGHLSHNLADVRWALAMNDNVPLITLDARDKLSVRDALLVTLRNAAGRVRMKTATSSTRQSTPPGSRPAAL